MDAFPRATCTEIFNQLNSKVKKKKDVQRQTNCMSPEILKLCGKNDVKEIHSWN